MLSPCIHTWEGGATTHLSIQCPCCHQGFAEKSSLSLNCVKVVCCSSSYYHDQIWLLTTQWIIISVWHFCFLYICITINNFNLGIWATRESPGKALWCILVFHNQSWMIQLRKSSHSSAVSSYCAWSSALQQTAQPWLQRPVHILPVH